MLNTRRYNITVHTTALYYVSRTLYTTHRHTPHPPTHHTTHIHPSIHLKSHKRARRTTLLLLHLVCLDRTRVSNVLRPSYVPRRSCFSTPGKTYHYVMCMTLYRTYYPSLVTSLFCVSRTI